MDKKELMITALQQRLGESEVQMASLRADLTLLLDEHEKLKEELNKGKEPNV